MEGAPVMPNNGVACAASEIQSVSKDAWRSRSCPSCTSCSGSLQHDRTFTEAPLEGNSPHAVHKRAGVLDEPGREALQGAEPLRALIRRYDTEMSGRPCTVILLLLPLLGVGCSFAKQQTKSAADTQCASSCKNQPAESQGECIAHCTK
jgi:hypothetical protein